MDAFLGLRHTKPPSVPSDAVWGSPTSCAFRGKLVTLSRTLGQLFGALLVASANGRRLTTNDLIEVRWADDWSGGPEWADTIVRCQMLSLRRKLAPIGLGLVCKGWSGFVLVEITPQVYPRRGKHTGSDKNMYEGYNAHT